MELNKAQYDLDREIAKISPLSSGNVGKCNAEKVKILYQKTTCVKKLLQSKDWKIHH